MSVIDTADKNIYNISRVTRELSIVIPGEFVELTELKTSTGRNITTSTENTRGARKQTNNIIWNRLLMEVKTRLYK